MAAYRITISANSGTGGTAAFYFDSVGGKFYAESTLATEISAITPHTRESFAFLGCRASNNDTSALRIAADGTIVTDGWTPTGAATIYARWERASWKITLNKQSGTGGTDAAYYRIDGGGLYADDLCATPMYRVTPPTRTGYAFGGFYSATSGGTQYTNEDGAFLAEFTSMTLTANKTVYARWTAKTYTLAFDPNGGTCPTVSKTVTFGSAIGTLPSATHTRGEFNEWRVSGESITATTVWSIATDAVAVASWNPYVGRVVDYFGLGSSALVPFESDAGENRPHVVTRHYGRHSASARTGANQSLSRITAEQTGPAWRNPTVKYMVVSDTTIATYLGKAYAAETGGYMIVSVTVDTRTRRFPVVTVQGVANEGADAINKFFISVPVKARAQAQNLLGAVSGGGELQSCTLAATCNPVVLQECLAPCASDVVDGHYELHAETQAASGEAAPTCTSAGGFAALGEPAAMEGKNYARYRLTARKEIV